MLNTYDYYIFTIENVSKLKLSIHYQFLTN